MVQQSVELKCRPRNVRRDICAMAGIQRSVATKKVNLAMKTSLHLTWGQLKKQKRFLRSIGVEVECEQSDRDEQQRLIGDHLVGTMEPLYTTDKSSVKSSDGLKITMTPVVKVKSLRHYVTHLLDMYYQNGRLTWDTNGIPEDEVWIKIGGDHGGGSFKLCLQVLNIASPNATNNTHVILCFTEKDLRTNLDNVLSTYKNQIKQLQLMSWMDKKLRVFVYGDYEFLCKLFGLSGACGMYCCLWCLINKNEIHESPVQDWEYTKRTLVGLKISHQKFSKIAKFKKSMASQFDNCITEPIWDIPIDHVAPPYLHVLLGIVKKHHDMLVDTCHRIDILIAEEMSTNSTAVDNNPFGRFVCHLRQMRKLMDLRDTRKTHRQCLVNIDQKINTHAQKIPHFAAHEGPVAFSLEERLSNHKICVQAYHSRSLVGNHCHKYLKPNVYNDVCDSMVQKTRELTQLPIIIDLAQQTSRTFKTLNCLFF